MLGGALRKVSVRRGAVVRTNRSMWMRVHVSLQNMGPWSAAQEGVGVVVRWCMSLAAGEDRYHG